MNNINLKSAPFKITTRSSITNHTSQRNIKPFCITSKHQSFQSTLSLLQGLISHDSSGHHLHELAPLNRLSSEEKTPSFVPFWICADLPCCSWKTSCKRSKVFALRSSAVCIIHLQHFHLPTHEIWMRQRWPGATEEEGHNSAGCFVADFYCHAIKWLLSIFALPFCSAFNLIMECLNVRLDTVAFLQYSLVFLNKCSSCAYECSRRRHIVTDRCNYTSGLQRAPQELLARGCLCFLPQVLVPVEMVDSEV